MWRKSTREPSVGYGTGDVHAWIRNVEESSEEAAGRQLGNSLSVTADEEMDESYKEAQDLLQSWMTDKKRNENVGLELLELEDEMLLDTPLDRGTTSVVDHAEKLLCDSKRSSSRKGPKKMAWLSEPLSDVPGSLFSAGSSVSSHGHPQGAFSEETVEDVLERMRHVSMDRVSADELRKPPRVNPLHTMNMRHQQVRERREASDKAQRQRLAEQTARKEARRAAEQVLMKEEQEKVQKMKHENTLIQREMAVLRQELETKRKDKKQSIARERRIRQQAEAQLRTEEEGKAKYSQIREVKTERQKKLEETKRVLVSQLEIATAEEAKKNLRMLKSHFSAWYSCVVQRHVQLGKARAVADWRCLLRVWNAFRAHIDGRRTERESERMTEQMKKEHRNEQAATLFARRLYLSRCFSAWQLWTRKHLEKQELRKLMEQHQQKMSALLEAAATGALWSENTSASLDDSYLSSDSDYSQQDQLKTGAPKKDIQRQQHPERLPPHPPKQNKGVHLVTTKKAREHLMKVLGGDDVVKKAASQQQSWQKTSKNSVPHSVETPDTKEMNGNHNINISSRLRLPSRPGSDTRGNIDEEQVAAAEVPRAAVPVFSEHLPLDKVLAGPKKVNRVVRKPVKAVGPVGMTNRAAQMAERREARLQRMKELEEEKLAKLKAEEEERRQQEETEKLARIEAKREEKRLAHQREIEKQKELECHVRMVAQAEDHYQKSLMMTYGLAPWKRLITIIKHNEHRAMEHHSQVLMRLCFAPWYQITEDTVRGKEKEADSLYRDLLLKSHFRYWQEFVALQYGLEAAAEAHRQKVIVRQVVDAWQRFVTDEQLKQMANEEKADKLHERLLKRRVILCWKRYVPLAREEKLAETRRNQLRQRVANWLPDFQPVLDTSQ